MKFSHFQSNRYEFISSEYWRSKLRYLSVFSPNEGKYGPEKLRIRTLLTQCKRCDLWWRFHEKRQLFSPNNSFINVWQGSKYVSAYHQKQSTWGVPQKKVFLKISQNSQESTCARVCFLIKLQAKGLQLH